MAEAPDASRRWLLRAIVGIMSVQVVALAAVTSWLLYHDLASEVTTARIAGSVTGYAACMTALFAVAAAGLARRRRWARGPAIVLELLQVPIGYNLTAAGGYPVGVPMLALSVACAVLLFAPATRAELGIR